MSEEALKNVTWKYIKCPHCEEEFKSCLRLFLSDSSALYLEIKIILQLGLDLSAG